MRFFVVGCGYMGSIHSRNIRFLDVDSEIYLFDIDFEKAKRLAEEIKGFAVDGIPSDKSFDLVVIATPAWTHFDIFKKVYSLGNYIFIEKPVVLSEEDFREVSKYSEKVFVGHQLRFFNFFNELKTCSNAISMFIRGPCMDVMYGGALFDLGIHIIDLAVYIGAQKLVKAEGSLDNLYIELDGDRLYTIKVSRSSKYAIGYECSGIKAFGDGLNYHINNRRIHVNNPYLEEMKDVLEAIKGSKKSRISLDSVKKSYEILFEVANTINK